MNILWWNVSVFVISRDIMKKHYRIVFFRLELYFRFIVKIKMTFLYKTSFKVLDGYGMPRGRIDTL